MRQSQQLLKLEYYKQKCQHKCTQKVELNNDEYVSTRLILRLSQPFKRILSDWDNSGKLDTIVSKGSATCIAFNFKDSSEMSW